MKDNQEKKETKAPLSTALGAKQNTSGEAEATLMIGELTPQEEQALKAKHERIRKIKVKRKDGGTSVVYCKYPDRNVVALAMSKRGQHKILEAGEAILDNCFVAGDEECKQTDSLRIASAMECYELLDFLEASSVDL